MLDIFGAARFAIEAVSPGLLGTWFQSTGYTIAADGTQIPTYATGQQVWLQVQPPSGRDLQQINYLQMQGVIRSVWMRGNPQGIVRVNPQGGDLLQFPQVMGAPVDNWLVAPRVDETWAVDATGWAHVIVTLQTDRPPTVDSAGTVDEPGTVDEFQVPS